MVPKKLAVIGRPLIFPSGETVEYWKVQNPSDEQDINKAKCVYGFTLLTRIPKLSDTEIKQNDELMNGQSFRFTAEMKQTNTEQKKHGWFKIINPFADNNKNKNGLSDTVSMWCIDFLEPGDYNLWGYELFFPKPTFQYFVGVNKEFVKENEEINDLINYKIDSDQNYCFEESGDYGWYQRDEKDPFNLDKYRKNSKNIEWIEEDAFDLKVAKPEAFKFDIREMPPPLQIGKTTDWITIHVSRKPEKVTMRLEPLCKSEPKLKYEFEDGEAIFEQEAEGRQQELDPAKREIVFADEEEEERSQSAAPFRIKFKITAPKS